MISPVARALNQHLSHAVTSEAAVRQLLDLLGHVCGLDCVYLALAERHRARQRVHLAFQGRADGVVVPEGATVDWDATLCRRALAEGVAYTAGAERWWDQSPPASRLGIRTFMSQPVLDAGGALLGTLCGASRDAVPEAPGTQATLRLFAELIGCYLQRDQALADVWEGCEARVAEVLAGRLGEAAAPPALAARLARAVGPAPHGGENPPA